MMNLRSSAAPLTKLTPKIVESNLSIEIKASLGFLAAGNVHFATPCAVLQLQGHSESALAAVCMPLETALAEASAQLQLDHSTMAAFRFGETEEPSTFVGHIARLALALQYLLGLDKISTPGWREFPAEKSHAVFSCMDRATGEAAATLALNLLIDGEESERAGTANRLIELMKPWTRPIAKVAMSRGIPVSLAVATERSFWHFGQGKKRRIFWRQFTPNTSHVATVFSTRKDLTARLLRDAGLPAPRNLVVGDAETAIRAAEALGYPVVVKPVATDCGLGVSTGNQNAEQVRNAFSQACQYGEVLIEDQIEGDQHRLLVVHGRCVKVSRHLSARVCGDGASTIAQLVEATNLTRTEHLTAAGKRIKLDEELLELLRRQGLTLSSVPSIGQTVLLRGNANLSSGGTAETMTEVAHPDVLRLAVQAAGLLGIDVAGIDYLTTDITRSPAETNGAICEINVTPGFVGSEEAIGPCLEPFFPDGDDGRIPTICIIDAIQEQDRFIDALSCLLNVKISRSDDVRFWKESERPALPRRTAAVLADPLTSAALITCTSQEIELLGLGIDRCSLAVLAPGVTENTIAAILRIATDAVVPASVFEQIAGNPLLAGEQNRIWVMGDGESPFSFNCCAGWVRRVASDSIEVCHRLGSPWRILSVPDSDAAEMVVTVGAALGISSERISQSLRWFETP